MQLASIMHQYHDAFKAKYSVRLLPNHWKAFAAIMRCRTAGAGTLQLHCTRCAELAWHGIPVPAGTAVALSVKTMKPRNGLIVKMPSNCQLSILW